MAECQSHEPARTAPSPVHIRWAVDGDAPAIVALIREVLEEVYGSRYPVMAARTPTTGEAYLKQPDLCTGFLVAESGGEIVGVVLPVSGRIFDLYVQHAMRARGVGAALLAAAEETLRGRGTRRTRLVVASEYPDLVAFYERKGWRPGRRSVQKWDQVPVIEMTKALQPWWRAVGPFWHWNLPKILLLLFGSAVVFLCNLAVVGMAKDRPHLANLTLGVMTLVVTWKVLQWDSGYLRNWKRFWRVLGEVASAYVTLALGAALCLVVLATAVLGDARSSLDIIVVIAVMYAVAAAWGEATVASVAWVWNRWATR